MQNTVYLFAAMEELFKRLVSSTTMLKTLLQASPALKLLLTVSKSKNELPVKHT